ncbi:MAG: CBS domain-containing protein [Myxococcaceae bacterium]
MTLEVVAVPPEFPLEQAHHLMLEHGMRHLVVMSGLRMCGVLSDRDVLLAATRRPGGALVYPNVSVGEVMSLAPVSATTRTPISELAHTMLHGHIDAIPIIERDRLVGLVTSSDLMRVLAMLPTRTPVLEFHVRRASELTAAA